VVLSGFMERETTMRNGLAAGIAAILLCGTALPASAQAKHGVSCLWVTMSQPLRDQVIATLANEAATPADWERDRLAMVPTAQACVTSEGWTVQQQAELTFGDAYTRASIESDSAALRKLGIDPAAVRQLYTALDPVKAAAMKRYFDLPQAEKDAVADYLRVFLENNGPARVAPGRGIAATLLISHAGLIDLGDQYRALKP
jgi:hypothetical protein